MTKTDRRVRKSKKAIREALLELLKKKEYTAISITELAGAADVDRKTFYLHYQSIEDVLQEILSETTESVRGLLTGSELFEIRDYFEGLSRAMMENITFYRMISTTTSYARFINECKDILKALLKETKYASSGLSEEAFNVYSEYISSGIIGIYTNWLASKEELSLDTLISLTADAVEHSWDKVMQ